MNERRRDAFIAVQAALFLLSIYLLVFTGRYYTTDEMAMSSAAESLVKSGRFSINQLLWINQSGGVVGVQGADGSLYSRNPVTQTLLMALVKSLTRPFSEVGQLQVLGIINPVLTAMTGGLLVLFGCQLGYSRMAACMAAIAFGLTTIALPYTKFMFAEPLIGLTLLTAACCMYGFRQSRKRLYLFEAGVALALAVATRPVNVVFAVIWWAYLCLLLFPEGDQIRQAKGSVAVLGDSPGKRLFGQSGLLLGPTLLCIALLGLYNWARFGNPLDSGYLAFENFQNSLLTGLTTILFSPGKSLWLYCPVLVWAVSLGGYLLVKRHALEGWGLLLGAGAVLFITAKWWVPDGGWGWGPRFAVGVIPLLSVGLFPVSDRSRAWRAILGITMLIGLSVQVLGSTVDFVRVLAELPPAVQPPESQAVVFDPNYSPLVLHARYLFMGKTDVLWLHAQNDQLIANLDLPILSLLLLNLGVGSGVGYAVWRYRHVKWWLSIVGVSVSALFSGMTVMVLLMRSYQSSQLDPSSMQMVLSRIQEERTPSIPSVIVTSAISHLQTLQNEDRTQFPVVGTLNQVPNLELVGAVYAPLFNTPHQIWLIQDWILPADRTGLFNQWLSQHAYLSTVDTFGSLSLSQYFTGRMITETSANIQFGAVVRLEKYGLSATLLHEGDVVLLSANWEAMQPTSADYTVFVHVLDSHGTLVTQNDRWPGNGFYPTSKWQSQEQIEDHFALQLPPKLLPGMYDLQLGWYNSTTLERLPVLNQQGIVVGDLFSVGSLTLVP